MSFAKLQRKYHKLYNVEIQMKRRDFLRRAACSAGGVILSTVNNGKASVRMMNRSVNMQLGRKRPNVIFILADDLGYAELGSYGQKKVRTPNLDKLAAEGMRFTNHYCGQAVCAPSRCVLMTGKHTGHAYIRNNKPVNGYQLPIPADTLTIAEVFKRNGYAAGCVGKWGLGGPDTEGRPNNQGFDLFYGNLGQVQAHWYYPPHLWKNDQKIELEGNYRDYGEHYSHDLMTKEALQFIRDNKKKPFFLYAAYLIPHVSLQAPDDSLDEYRALDWPETPTTGSAPGYTGCAEPKATYAAMITRMDRDVGRIMTLLKNLDLDKDTIVMFSSDNGATYCCGVDYKFFESAGSLKGLKGSLYEGGVRTPLIARWPGKIKPGVVSDHISAFWDFFPTCCDLIGEKAPDDIDGISYLPTLLGKGYQQRQHEYLYWEFPAYGYQQCVRMGKWKGYRKDVRNNSDPDLELYDLENDIGESTNLASQHPDIVAQIKQVMTEAHTPSMQFPLLPGE